MNQPSLFLAPAQKKEIAAIQAFIAECEAAIERATQAALAKLPWPAPSRELPYSSDAHWAFLAITVPYRQKLTEMYSKPGFAESYELAVPEDVRCNLPHRLTYGIDKHPDYHRWAAEVARCRFVRSIPIFQAPEASNG